MTNPVMLVNSLESELKNAGEKHAIQIEDNDHGKNRKDILNKSNGKNAVIYFQ